MSCHIDDPKTDFYLRTRDELDDFAVNQCVIIKEKFLKNIVGLGVDLEEEKRKSPPPPPCEPWYPYVNSYYPYTEDVDAIERVNHLLASRPSVESVASAGNTEWKAEEEVVPYSERATQIAYLESNPLCFVLLGKPGIGEESLAQTLAEYWQCVLVEPNLLVEQEIASGSKAGNCIEFNLRCGRSIGIDVLLKLAQKRIHSETARHRGFVLAGFPLIPNGLYEEDPATSQSAVFTAKEIFEGVIDSTVHLSAPPHPPPSLSSKYRAGEGHAEDDESETVHPEEEEAEEGTVEEAEMKTSVTSPKESFVIPVDVGADYDVFEYAEIGTDYQTQLNFLFNLLETPYLIVYLKSSTIDVINKRDAYRYDLYSNVTVDFLMTSGKEQILENYTREKDLTHDEIPEELFEEAFVNTHRSEVKHLTALPRDFPANVSSQMDVYHYVVMNFIEDKVLTHDPQYFLKLDGRTDPQRMFNILKARLDVLPVQKVVIPTLLDHVEEAADVGEDQQEPMMKGEVNEDEMRTCCKTGAPSDVYKWSLSDWGTRCPVSMKEGYLKEGKRDYAVHFMNKLFFLSGEDSFLKFYRNPRPYLLPPQPKPACKIYVYGPKCSGKTAVAKCLAAYFGGQALSIVHMLENLQDSKEDEYKEKVRRDAIREAVKLLDEMRKKEAEEKEKQRIVDIKEWVKKIVVMVEELLRLIDEQSKESNTTQFEISSFPMAMKSTKVTEMENEVSIAIRHVKDDLEANKIHISMDKANLERMMQDKKMFLKFLPEELRTRFVPVPAKPNDDFVLDYAERAVANVDLGEIQLNNMNIVDMFKEVLRNVEDDFIRAGRGRGGWVLDGMICDPFLMKELYPEYMADEVILLQDTDDFEFLLKRYETKDGSWFDDYRDFFESIGRPDIALRCSSEVSTASTRRRYVREILSYAIDDAVYRDEESSVQKRAQAYRSDLINYKGKWESVRELFLQHGIQPIELKVTDKSLPQLMKEAIETVEKRYRAMAYHFTEEDRAEEVKAFVDATIPEEAATEDLHGSNREQLEENRRYGDTSFYCPVAFRDNWILWRGKEDLAAKFLDRLYLLSSPEALQKFMSDPQSYLPGIPPKKLPPPRICVIGLPFSGKTSLAKAISFNYGIQYISFESLLKKEWKMDTEESIAELYQKNRLNVAAQRYLIDGVALNEDFFKNTLLTFWNEYPLRHAGFVLDDFPKRPSDIPLMTKYHLVPDAVLLISVKDLVVHDRMLEQYMASWREGIETQQAALDEKNRIKMAEWERKREIRFHELMEERKEKRYAEKKKELQEQMAAAEGADKTGMTSTSQVSYDSVSEMRDIDEIHRLLDVDLPEVPMETLESPAEAKAKIDRFVVSILSTERDAVGRVEKACLKEAIPVIRIESEDGFERAYRRALYLTERIKYRTPSMFERCYEVSSELADKLISCGYVFASRFGKTCPVQYLECRMPFQMYSPMLEKASVFPVVHRYYVYYIVGEENLEKFKREPLKYTNVENFEFPLIPFRLAVTGPPKCGKTLLADRVKLDTGMKVLSRGQAARYVLNYLPYSELAKNMEIVLRKGWELTDEMVAGCVEAAAVDRRAVTQGLILDGAPNSTAEVTHLSYCGLVPKLVIDLQARDSEIYECLSNDSGRRGNRKYTLRYIRHLWEEWCGTAAQFRDWFDKQYQVTAQVPICTSNWSVWTQVRKLIYAVFFEIKHYHVKIKKGWPLRIANMQVAPLEFLERQSSYKTYCPCCLYHSKELTCGGMPPDRTGLVQFRDFFYWICDEHINEFLETPEMFLPPYNPNLLPQKLPVIEHLKTVPANVFENGFCPICYRDTRLLCKGDPALAVAYDNKVYLFDVKEHLRRFVKSPQSFMIRINFRQPDEYPDLNYRELPVLGMLEQYVARPVIRALSSVSTRRPVIPGLEITTSAMIGIGLCLKVNNERLPEEYKVRYREADEVYHRRRTELLQYLDKMKSVLNPYLDYEEPLPKFEMEDTPMSTTEDSLTTAMSKYVDDMFDEIEFD